MRDGRNGIQWNPFFNTDTLGPLVCVLIRGVSSFQGQIIPIYVKLGLVKCPD